MREERFICQDQVVRNDLKYVLFMRNHFPMVLITLHW